MAEAKIKAPVGECLGWDCPQFAAKLGALANMPNSREDITALLSFQEQDSCKKVDGCVNAQYPVVETEDK